MTDATSHHAARRGFLGMAATAVSAFAGLLATAARGAPVSSGEPQPGVTDGIAEKVGKPTIAGYPNRPFVVMARIRARPGREADLRARLIEAARYSSFEPKCLCYEWLQEEKIVETGVVDRTYFRSIEWWEDEDAVRAHVSSPHYKAFFDLEAKDPVVSEVTNTIMFKLRD